jgi:hypothetical protein
MKVTTNEQGVIQLEEVFSGIILKTPDGEEMTICMRDSGFEINYQGEWYFAKEGFVEPFKEDKINVSTQELINQMDYLSESINQLAESTNQRFDKLIKQKEENLVTPGPAHLARMSERDRLNKSE